jgi:GH24 family phage-related lysozyme (muramidase)
MRVHRWLRAAILSIAFIALLAGCGSTTTRTITVAPTIRGVQEIPAAVIKVAPETARQPSGPGNPTSVPSTVGITRAVLGALPSLSAFTGSSIHIDEPGLELIERFEEVRKSTYCPYWDAYGHVYTRGFGETDWSGNFGGRCITLAQAEANLHYLIETHYIYAVRDLDVNLDHHQIAGLTSFVWNLGAGIFTGTLRYDLQHRDFRGAASIMRGYDFAGGVYLAGLHTRRLIEAGLVEEGEAPAKSAAQIRAERVKRLYSEYSYRTHIRVYLHQHHCRRSAHPRYVPNTVRQRAQCAIVEAHGGRANREIRRLRKLGAR